MSQVTKWLRANKISLHVPTTDIPIFSSEKATINNKNQVPNKQSKNKNKETT